MPIYEYVCEKCKKITDVRATFAGKDKGLKVKCASCGSEKTHQCLSAFYVGGTSESTSSSCPTCPTCSSSSCSTCR